MSQARRPVLLSAPIHKYRDVFRLVGRTPLSARDAFVPSKSARGPTAVQGDRPTSAVQALNSSSYLRIGVLSHMPRMYVLVLFAVAGVCRILLGQQSAPDLVLSNGKIVTVDERFRIAQAVAIRGGRIAAVGSNQEIAQLAGRNTRVIDLRGRTVIPGLIDNHMHLLRAATTWLRELRFDGVESRKQAIEMLRARVKAAGTGGGVSHIGGS